METPQIQHVFSKDRKLLHRTICNILAHLKHKIKEGLLKHICDVIGGDTGKGGRYMENPTRSGGGTEGDNIFSGLKAQYVDLGKKGSKE